ncbi:YqaE/Pmp3 family membrane protein [soil metagenome]|jgi:uncharacterized membrane protein YqaE (UPF0057 family)
MILRYFLCFLLPPAAVLSTGNKGGFVLNTFLTLFFWVPGIIHAVWMINKFYEDKRQSDMMGIHKRNYWNW